MVTISPSRHSRRVQAGHTVLAPRRGNFSSEVYNIVNNNYIANQLTGQKDDEPVYGFTGVAWRRGQAASGQPVVSAISSRRLYFASRSDCRIDPFLN
jgi:hypothetical protein